MTRESKYNSVEVRMSYPFLKLR